MLVRMRAASIAAAALLTLAAGFALAQAPAAPIASQDTNWSGIVADVTEFKRKGNTLTAKLKLRNTGTANARADWTYAGVYLLDTEAGKKYEVLKDENGAAIAALHQGFTDRWYEEIAPNGAHSVWMKFPAPPVEVKSVTLQIEGMPPFDDLPIQDQ